ncbi:hypothetical protein ACWD62_25460 [Streptomyces sp. NPDC005146]
MLDTLDRSVQPCTECGTEIRTDPRFVVWCAACDWNMDPGEPEETPGRLERLRRRPARQHGEKLLAEVTAGKTLRRASSEYERQRRCSALQGHSVDTAHPPTHLRRACLLTGAPTAAEVVAAPERQAALDAELAKVRETLAREILNGR